MRFSAISNTFLAVMAMCAALEVRAVDSGKAKYVQGEVRIERAGKLMPLRVGDSIQERDRVEVASTGSAGITLTDETLISLGPNSTLVIDNFAFDSKTNQGRVETSILRGAMRYVTGLIGRVNPKSIRVTTPTGTIGIRGTEFIVETADGR